MTRPQIPLIILGGRDRRLAEMADNGRGRRPLQGYKGAELQFGGKPLIQTLVDRMAACGVFAPILIAGPRHVYEPWLEGAEIIDTDDGFGDNLKAGTEWARRELQPRLLAVTTCDILPDPDELREIADDLAEWHESLDFWMPQITFSEAPGTLGASDWKPKYRLVPREGGPSVPILPGHMIIADPEAVRLSFVYRFFGLLYRTRNRSLSYRRLVVARHLLWGLVLEDLHHLSRLRLPTVLLSVAYSSLLMAAKLKAGTASVSEMEFHIRRALIRRSHRREHPERHGRVLLCRTMSLAKDVDTEEEARELADLDTRGDGA